jgi:hypothetical protein
MPIWETTGKFAYVYFPSVHEGSYPLPVVHNTGLPKLPAAGITRIEDFASAKAAAPIPQTVESALSPSVYTYYARQNTRRSPYRIPLR